MPVPQDVSREQASRLGFQELLRWDSVPASLAATLINQKVISAIPSVVGAYKCFIDLHGVSAIDVTLKPGVIAGVFKPSLTVTLADGSTAKIAATDGSNFASNTVQTISLTGLRGERRAVLSFTIPGGGSIASFSIAEVSGK